MKPKLHLPTAVLPIALFVVVCFSLFPSPSYSQSLAILVFKRDILGLVGLSFYSQLPFLCPKTRCRGRSHATSTVRVKNLIFWLRHFLPDSTQGGYNFELSHLLYKAVFQLQVDRLGLRLAVEENYVFQGVIRVIPIWRDKLPEFSRPHQLQQPQRGPDLYQGFQVESQFNPPGYGP